MSENINFDAETATIPAKFANRRLEDLSRGTSIPEGYRFEKLKFIPALVAAHKTIEGTGKPEVGIEWWLLVLFSDDKTQQILVVIDHIGTAQFSKPHQWLEGAFNTCETATDALDKMLVLETN